MYVYVLVSFHTHDILKRCLVLFISPSILSSIPAIPSPTQIYSFLFHYPLFTLYTTSFCLLSLACPHGSFIPCPLWLFQMKHTYLKIQIHTCKQNTHKNSICTLINWSLWWVWSCPQDTFSIVPVQSARFLLHCAVSTTVHIFYAASLLSALNQSCFSHQRFSASFSSTCSFSISQGERSKQ